VNEKIIEHKVSVDLHPFLPKFVHITIRELRKPSNQTRSTGFYICWTLLH